MALEAPAPLSPLKLLMARERGGTFRERQKRQAANALVPSHFSGIFCNLGERVFCGKFSNDGGLYAAASQDSMISIFDFNQGRKLSKTVPAVDVGWAVIDIDFSVDGGSLIYSSWNRCVHRFSTRDNDLRQTALDFAPPSTLMHFCLFSIRHSADGSEIVGGANDASLYVYDLRRGERTLRLSAAQDDVNAVCWGDPASNLLLSGGDDRTIALWDRRALGADAKPAGLLTGHRGGITALDAKGDGCTVLSNGKDHTLRLWDLRALGSERPASARGGRGGRDGANLMTLRGHTVRDTLVRAYFSPAASTGRRYVYTGSACGSLFVFDAVRGERKCEVEGHGSVVREAAWHPDLPLVLTASWDGTVGTAEYRSGLEAGEAAPPSSARVIRRRLRSWSDG